MSDATPRNMPVLLVTPNTMSAKDIGRMQRLGGICVVECADPEASRFCEPPLGANLDEQSRAALHLLRYIVSREFGGRPAEFQRGELTKFYVQALIEGKTPETVAPVKRKV